MRPSIPENTHFNSSSSSTGTRTTPSQMNSYYSNSPAARNNPFLRRNELDRHNHDSSTTIYSSSHQSDSLYNEPTRQHTPRILTTSMNTRWKTTDSPSYNRKNLSPLPKTQDNDDDDDDDHRPRQILLPIGGGVVGKLASSTTNLSYRKCRFTSERSRTIKARVLQHWVTSSSRSSLEIACLSFFLSILGSSNSAEHSPMNHPHRKSSSNVYKDELVCRKPFLPLSLSIALRLRFLHRHSSLSFSSLLHRQIPISFGFVCQWLLLVLSFSLRLLIHLNSIDSMQKTIEQDYSNPLSKR